MTSGTVRYFTIFVLFICFQSLGAAPSPWNASEVGHHRGCHPHPGHFRAGHGLSTGYEVPHRGGSEAGGPGAIFAGELSSALVTSLDGECVRMCSLE